MLKLLTFLTLSVPPLSPCQGAIVEFAKHEVISDITVTLTELLPCVTDSMWSHSLSETVFQVGDISPLSIRNPGLKNWSQVQGYWVANPEFISSLPDSKTSTRLFPIPYGVPGAARNAHVSSWFPPRMKSPWFSPTWVQRKLLKLINYFDDSHRTSGSPFLPCFMAGKNRWDKGIKGELDFLVQGVTAYYKSEHSVLCLSTPSGFQLCVTATWSGQSLAQTVFSRFYLKMSEGVQLIVLPLPQEDSSWLGTDLASWVGVTPVPLSDAIWFLSSPHRPLQLESLLLNEHGIQIAK